MSKYAALLALVLLALCLGTAVWHQIKPLADGIGHDWPLRPAQTVTLLRDMTWQDDSGERQSDQQIFDAAIAMIDQASTLVVADMFLFNDFAGDASSQRPLAAQFSQALLRARRRHPDMPVVLISDPFNTLYGGVENPYFDRLSAAGVTVVETPLGALRDVNPIWSTLWRICCQWFGNSSRNGWLPSPVGTDDVSLRTYLALLNFKANHRKTLVTGTHSGLEALVTSGNPHDASSAHWNVGLRFDGAAAHDLLASERAILRLAGIRVPGLAAAQPPPTTTPSSAQLQVLTEARIRDAVIRMLDDSGANDRVTLMMFYLSHRDVVSALIAAHARGAAVQVLLDPSEDAFGRKKNGIPNRQTAAELVNAGLPLRWCNTHGEQCHGKQLQVRYGDGTSALLLGSGNFTRRNLDNYNLETSVLLRAPDSHPVQQQAAALFGQLWGNTDGRRFSLDYSAFRDDSWPRKLLYRVMEASGLSTF